MGHSVIDSNDRDRFVESKKELHALILNEPELTTIPLLIYANKQDAHECMSVDEIAENLFDFELNNYPVIIHDNEYRNGISELILKQFETADDMQMSEQICQIIAEFVPSEVMFGSIGQRLFCVIPVIGISATNQRERKLTQNIYDGLDWMDKVLRKETSCLMM